MPRHAPIGHCITVLIFILNLQKNAATFVRAVPTLLTHQGTLCTAKSPHGLTATHFWRRHWGHGGGLDVRAGRVECARV